MADPIEATSCPVDDASCGQAGEAQVLSYAPGPDEESRGVRRKKRACMVAVLLPAILAGAAFGAMSSAPSWDSTPVELALGFLFNVCAVVWIAIDGHSRHRQVGNGMRLLAFFIPPLGIVAYYLLLKDWRGLGRAVLFMLGVFLAMMASGAVSVLVAEML